MPPTHSVESLSLVLNKVKTLTPALIRLHIFKQRCGQRTLTEQLGESISPALSNTLGDITPLVGSGKLLSFPGCNSTIILGYAHSGHLHHALELCEVNVATDGWTFIGLLKACAKLKDLDACQRIDALLDRQGLFGKNVYVSGSLIHTYVRCGCLTKAQELFERIPIRNIVLWTVMISGLVNYGLHKEALLYYKQMQEHGMCMDVTTFICVLKACASIETIINDGYGIHTDVIGRGFDHVNDSVCNCLIDMYAKCGLLSEAQVVFENHTSRDVVSWNALIGGYVEHGPQEKALHFFERMQGEGIFPSVITYVCILKACSGIGAINEAQAIHINIIQKGILEIDAFVGSILVDLYAKCALLEESQKVFEALLFKDIVSWNALISGYVNQRKGEEAIHYFEQMQCTNVTPDVITFICVLKACTMTGAMEKGCVIHAQISSKGLESEVMIQTSLIDMYCRFGLFHKAEELLFKYWGQRTVICLNALITGYEVHGHQKKVLMCFKQLLHDSILPDEVTFICSLKACGSLGRIVEGQKIHAQVISRGFENDLLVGSTLVVMYTKCGSPADAQVVFSKLSVRNVVSWTALIAGHSQLLGARDSIFHLFDSMVGEGIQPDLVAFLSLLSVCNHLGLVEKGQAYFFAVCDDGHSLIPMLEHFTCVVDILGRAGHVDEVVSMIQNMPFHPNTMSWHSLLGACQESCNTKLGEYAFENTLVLDKSDFVAYVSLFNIYAKHLQAQDM